MFSSPGRTIAWLPRLSRCSTSPSSSQLTVCRPVCGWAQTCIPGDVADVLGAVVIEEAPGADHPDLPVRQRPGHLGGLAQRHPASGDQQLFRADRPSVLRHTCSRGLALQITHALRSSSPGLASLATRVSLWPRPREGSTSPCCPRPRPGPPSPSGCRRVTGAMTTATIAEMETPAPLVPPAGRRAPVLDHPGRRRPASTASSPGSPIRSRRPRAPSDVFGSAPRELARRISLLPDRRAGADHHRRGGDPDRRGDAPGRPADPARRDRPVQPGGRLLRRRDLRPGGRAARGLGRAARGPGGRRRAPRRDRRDGAVPRLDPGLALDRDRRGGGRPGAGAGPGAGPGVDPAHRGDRRAATCSARCRATGWSWCSAAPALGTDGHALRGGRQVRPPLRPGRGGGRTAGRPPDGRRRQHPRGPVGLPRGRRLAGGAATGRCPTTCCPSGPCPATGTPAGPWPASIYDPLLAAGGGLLETLVTFLDHGLSVEAAARALFVHANTVRYRLRRIHEVTGYSPTDPRDAYALRLALTLGRLLRPGPSPRTDRPHCEVRARSGRGQSGRDSALCRNRTNGRPKIRGVLARCSPVWSRNSKGVLAIVAPGQGAQTPGFLSRGWPSPPSPTG